MPSLATFGQMVKRRYPQYAEVPDEELAKFVIEKYPEYRGVVFSGAAGNTAFKQDPNAPVAPTTEPTQPTEPGGGGRLAQIGNAASGALGWIGEKAKDAGKFITKDLLGMEEKQQDGVLQSVFQQTVGSKGVAGVFQLPGKVLSTIFATKEQKQLSEAQIQSANMAYDAIKRARKYEKGSPQYEKWIQISKDLLASSTEGNANWDELEKFTITPKEAAGTTGNALITLAPVGKVMAPLKLIKGPTGFLIRVGARAALGAAQGTTSAMSENLDGEGIARKAKIGTIAGGIMGVASEAWNFLTTNWPAKAMKHELGYTNTQSQAASKQADKGAEFALKNHVWGSPKEIAERAGKESEVLTEKIRTALQSRSGGAQMIDLDDIYNSVADDLNAVGARMSEKGQLVPLTGEYVKQTLMNLDKGHAAQYAQGPVDPAKLWDIRKVLDKTIRNAKVWLSQGADGPANEQLAHDVRSKMQERIAGMLSANEKPWFTSLAGWQNVLSVTEKLAANVSNNKPITAWTLGQMFRDWALSSLGASTIFGLTGPMSVVAGGAVATGSMVAKKVLDSPTFNTGMAQLLDKGGQYLTPILSKLAPAEQLWLMDMMEQLWDNFGPKEGGNTFEPTKPENAHKSLLKDQ